jgi:hypothetical protein
MLLVLPILPSIRAATDILLCLIMNPKGGRAGVFNVHVFDGHIRGRIGMEQQFKRHLFGTSSEWLPTANARHKQRPMSCVAVSLQFFWRR